MSGFDGKVDAEGGQNDFTLGNVRPEVCETGMSSADYYINGVQAVNQESCIVTAIGFQVTGTSGGPTIKVGIYGHSLVAGVVTLTKLAEGSGVVNATGVQWVNLSSPYTLPKGRYWFVFIKNNVGGMTIRAKNNLSTGVNWYHAFRYNQGSHTLPASLSITTEWTDDVRCVRGKIQGVTP